MLTVISFILTLGILIAVHEYGHFQVAKWCGVRILKFSIGFGQPIWAKKIGADQTEFILAAIPLGGFVKMLDEREFDEDDSPKETYTEEQLVRAFNRQSVFKRIAIVIAGPAANLILAIALYWLLFMMGVSGMKPVIGRVADHSPAAEASLAIGQTIQKINGKEVASWQEVSWTLLNQSLNSSNVEVQTISDNQEIHVHQLNLSKLNLDNPSKDSLGVLGLTTYQPDITPRIGEVLKNSPAYLAGFKTDDLVLSVGNTKVKVWDDFVSEIRLNPNKPLDVLVLRNSTETKLTVNPEPDVENGKTVGRIGAAFKIEQSELDKIFITKNYSATEAFTKAIEKTWTTSTFTLKMLGRMVTGQASWKGISGPVTIASYAGQSAHMGIKVFIGFLALISISLGVLNLLPIPVLDGGHLMYYMVEIFTRKPVPEAVIIIGQKVGISLLGLMMVIAFYNDINRLITG